MWADFDCFVLKKSDILDWCWFVVGISRVRNRVPRVRTEAHKALAVRFGLETVLFFLSYVARVFFGCECERRIMMTLMLLITSSDVVKSGSKRAVMAVTHIEKGIERRFGSRGSWGIWKKAMTK